MLTNAKLTNIPLPGGSGIVPSGALQFQDDWPGLFIRGDEALGVGLHIGLLLQALKEKPSDDPRIWTAIPLLERETNGVRAKHVTAISDVDSRTGR